MLNRLRELTKSFANQVESERTEELKRTKAEFETNVTRILNLIKNEDNQHQGKGKRKASKRDTELLGLVETCYKKFASLSAFCDQIIADSRKKSARKTESEYSSDSEYYSSEEIDISNAKLEAEISELKEKLGSINEENKALGVKVEELEKINKVLKMEVDKKGREISAWVKADEANERRSLARIKELEGQLSGLKIEKDKRKGLASRVLELELVLKDKEGENSVLVKKLEEGEERFALKIKELASKNGDLRAEIDSLHGKKGELEEVLACERENGVARVKELMGLEAELDRKSEEISGHLVKIESLNEELAKKIIFQNNTTEEAELQVGSSQVMNLTAEINDREENSDSLEHKKEELELNSERNSQESTKTSVTNLRVLERKVEDMAEKIRISFEDNLPLLYQRILVAEQLHNENKESYKAMKERHEREKRESKEKIEGYENALKKVKQIAELAQNAMNGLGSVVSKFEEENGQLSNRVTKVSNELKLAKRWVQRTSGEIKRLKHNVDCLVAFLDHKEEQEFVLREKVWKLEAKASKEGGEKLNLMQEISQLEKKMAIYERLVKDKDERLFSLGDEKREVIRQLCMSVDYHRSRVDQLKQVILKMRMGW